MVVLANEVLTERFAARISVFGTVVIHRACLS